MITSAWDAGTVEPHGSTQTYNGIPAAWPDYINTIDAKGQGADSPWIGFVRSSGYWDVIYRWQGRGAPPKTRYAVPLRTDVNTDVQGRGVSFTRAVKLLDGFPEKYLPVSRASSHSGGPTTAQVQHDDSGYFLRVSTEPVFGEVKQADHSLPWAGDVRVSVRYGRPRAM